MSTNEIKSYDNLDKTTILQLVSDMQLAIKEPEMVELKNNDKGQYIRHMRERFIRLNDRYPGIFNMVLTNEDKMDMRRLTMMLNLLETRERGEISNYDADVRVGQDTFNEFVSPVINMPASENRESAIEDIE